MRGQAEIIVVFAIIAVALVAVMFALQSGIDFTPPGPEITGEAATIRDSVANLMKTGLREQTNLLYDQGGVIEFTSLDEKAPYGIMDIKVWQGCGDVGIPDVPEQIRQGLSDYIHQNLKSEEEFFGKDTEFDFSDLDIKIQILPGTIRAVVDLPTTIDGETFDQPYEITLPSNLYEILDFSANFVTDTDATRPFETLTLYAMTRTNRDSEDWIPMPGVETDCNSIIMRRGSEITPAMKKIVRYVASHVTWNINPIYVEGNPFFNLNTVNGKQYPDLYVSFEYPRAWDDSFEENFIVFPDPIQGFPVRPIPGAPLCITPITVQYSVKYPMLVHVEDPTTGRIFTFAVWVSIVNNEPGSCELPPDLPSDYASVCEENTDCNARVTVLDATDQPIEGADVTFDICALGKTDSSGVLEADIPCSWSKLMVYKTGYKSYGELKNDADLKDLTVNLVKYQDSVTFHIYGLALKPETKSEIGTSVGFAKYTITEAEPISSFPGVTVLSHIDPKDPNPFVPEDQTVYLDLLEDGENRDVVEVEGVYPNEAVFYVQASDEANYNTIGLAQSELEITSDMTEFFVYIPIVMDESWEPGSPYSYLTGNLDEGEIMKISEGMASCGLPALATEEKTLSGSCTIQ